MKVKVKSLSCVDSLRPHGLTPWSPPGSSAHRSFQARVLEWDAMAFSVNVKWLQFDGETIP